MRSLSIGWRRVVLPNFFVIGAGRSGTTSLHYYLSQHPQVFIPAVKSPSHFYCVDHQKARTMQRRLVTRDYFVYDRNKYEALFDGAGAATAVGDVSPAYLASTTVPTRIHDAVPDARIVCILRNPVERFIARYVAQVRDGYERHPSLSDLVDTELERPVDLNDTAGTYFAAGFVSVNLRTYMDLFGPDSVKITFFDDLVTDAAGMMRDIFGFLQVDDSYPVDVSVRHNQSRGVIANPLMRFLWSSTSTARAFVRPFLPPHVRDKAFSFVGKSLETPDITEHDRRRLSHAYASEIQALGALTDRDLSGWLTQ